MTMEKVYDNHLEHRYENGEDVNVRKYLAYGKSEDHKLYYDKEFTDPVTQDDAEDAMGKGMLLIIAGTATLVPLAMSGNTVATITGVDSAALIKWTVEATA